MSFKGAGETIDLTWEDEEEGDSSNHRYRHHPAAYEDDASLALALQLQEEEELIGRNMGKQTQEGKRQRTLQTESENLALALKLQDEEEAKPRDFMTKDEILQNLHPCQRQALQYVQTRSRPLREESLPALSGRLQQLGVEEDALDRCLRYIRDEAPIVIHLHERTLSLLVHDTHYRNLFETNTSSGSKDTTKRREWERKLFGNAYTDQCKASLRPKYGCLNMTGDIAGVRPARNSYGTLFLTLAPHVRYRATFCAQDSGSADCKYATTHDTYGPTLAQYTDPELLALCNVSRIGGAPSRCVSYKEVQIHGPVCLATDIQTLSVPGYRKDAQSELLKIVEQFQKMSNCNILWQDDLLGV